MAMNSLRQAVLDLEKGITPTERDGYLRMLILRIKKGEFGEADVPQTPSRCQIAEAIADGWTNGNETYEAQNDIMRMRLDSAADAVLALTRPDRGAK